MMLTGMDRPGWERIDAVQPVAQPKALAEVRPLQVVSIDHIDPADLMSLDPSQLDRDHLGCVSRHHAC